MRRKKKVAIVGAGFGGFAAMREFNRLIPWLRDTEITLLDQNNYHLFIPLLYQVCAGGIDPDSICFPIRSHLRKGGTVPPIMFRECSVHAVDVEKKVIIADRLELSYDYLVFAPGSHTNYYGIPDVEPHVFELKTIRDAMGIHSRILECFEAALLETDEARRRFLLTFVIVGGGPTGVETASMISAFVHKSLVREFQSLTKVARVIMVEATMGLLGGSRPEASKIAYERMVCCGVDVMLGCPASRVTAEGIHLKDGRFIPARTVLWGAGITPDPLCGPMPADKSRDGRIIIDQHLEVTRLPGLYVIGDCAYREQPGSDKAYPPTAQVALRQGKTCARNIASQIMGRPQKPFRYKFKGDLIFLGRNHAVGELGNMVIKGFPAFMVYQTYYITRLMGFRNKLTTLIDWAYDYFYERNTVKLG
ncbi:MAG: NAD(P)/FAD-dependent oxidoreductase [Chloroflexi bacterium]|nr:NAD(P)/FAD-dependent oxidoreductase [Chloroflexota bacterium]